MTKDEQVLVCEEIVTMLLASERFDIRDVYNRYPHSTAGEGRVIAKLIWAAREVLREEHGVVFGVIPKWPGVFRRLDWSQVAAQAQRQRGAGTRKHRRAEQKLRLAATDAPDAEQQRISDAADRIALRIAMRATRES